MFLNDIPHVASGLWTYPANTFIERRISGETVVIGEKEGLLFAVKRVGGQCVSLILSGLPTKSRCDQDTSRTYDQLKYGNLQLVGPCLNVMPSLLGGSPNVFSKELLASVPALKQWFRKHPHVTEVNLQNLGVGTDEIRVLAAALPGSEITRLNLSNSQISDEGVKFLAESLSRSRVLELDLSNNSITASGIKALASALPFSLVSKLHLRDCNIGDEGALALALMLPSSGLVYVDLKNNKIGASGVEAIRKVSPPFSALQIDLSGNAVHLASNVSVNQITSAGAVTIPKKYICPITGKIMRDPVWAADGETYEREAIEKHLQNCDTSPLDKNIRLEHKNLFPAKALKGKIENFFQKHPDVEQKDCIPEASKQACLTALAEGDVDGLKALLEQEQGLLSVNFPNGQLIELACGASPELLKTVIEAYSVRPYLSHGLCIKAAEGVGIEGVRHLFNLMPKKVPMSLPMVLFEALELGSSAYLNVLISMGVSPNSKHIDGSCLLHRAVELGDHAVIDLLLEWGADIKAIDREGRTPLQLADQLGKFDLLRYIKQKKSEIKTRLTVGSVLERFSALEKRVQQLEEQRIVGKNGHQQIEDKSIVQNTNLPNSFQSDSPGFTPVKASDNDWKKITEADLPAMSSGRPDLIAVDLTKFQYITDSGLIVLSKRCPNLTAVNLEGCVNITDRGVIGLARNCPNLTFVDLSNCKNITDNGVSAIAEHSPALSVLSLAGCNITDSCVSAVAESCPHLTSVDLQGCSNITDRGVFALAECCSNLASVNLGYYHYDSKVTDSVLRALEDGCRNLLTMNLGRSENITDDGLFALAEYCPELTAVRMSRSKPDKVTTKGLSALVNGCLNLVILELDDSNKIGQYRTALRRRY